MLRFLGEFCRIRYSLPWFIRSFNLNRAVDLAGVNGRGDPGYLWELYGISIAFAIPSFDRSLFTHLLELYRVRYSLTCWISIALAIHSLDPLRCHMPLG